MNKTDEYIPPKVWKWDAENGGRFASINRPIAGATHEKWGETPCAYIEFTNGASASVDELRDWCKQELAGYKVPGKFVFAPIPKTSTGKVQKFVLREQVLKLED